MFFKETADASRGDCQWPLPLQAGGELFETQLGIFDVFDQHQDGRLRAQRRRRARRCRDHRGLALLSVKGCLDREISKLAFDLDAIQLSVLLQMG